MKNLKTQLYFIAGLLFCNLSLVAQPEISLWRVTADHSHDSESGAVEEYNCGTNYYLVHGAPDKELHFSIRNDGDATLELQLPLTMAMMGSPFLTISQPDQGSLAPGEETHFSVTYTNNGKYVPNQRSGFTIMSNDVSDRMCGLLINVGNVQDLYVCVCEDGVLTDVDQGFFPGIGLNPNQVYLHEGMCDSQVDVCPPVEALQCYFSPYFGFITGTLDFETFGPPFFPVSDGYCPCLIEQDFCVFDENGVLPPTTRNEEINTREISCIGEDRTFYVDSWCFDLAGVKHGFDALPAEYTYTWCTDGSGVFTSIPADMMGLDATSLSGWLPGDEVLVKVENELGCIGIGYYQPIYILFPTFGLVFQNIGEEACVNQEITICALSSDPELKERNDIKTRAHLDWSTNGDGILSEPFDIEGEECITITGAGFGDRVIAVENSGECPGYGSIEMYLNPTCAMTAENIGLYGISLDDPCNCADPLNIVSPTGVTEFFHDILSIDNLLPGISVTITPSPDFLDSNGDPIIAPIGAITDANGRIEYDFWHAPGVAATADVSYMGPTGAIITIPFISSTCIACAPIPTLGQWGIMILLALILIFASVAIKQKNRKIYLIK